MLWATVMMKKFMQFLKKMVQRLMMKNTSSFFPRRQFWWFYLGMKTGLLLLDFKGIFYHIIAQTGLSLFHYFFFQSNTVRLQQQLDVQPDSNRSPRPPEGGLPGAEPGPGHLCGHGGGRLPRPDCHSDSEHSFLNLILTPEFWRIFKNISKNVLAKETSTA